MQKFSSDEPIGLAPLAAKPATGKKVIHLTNSASPEDVVVDQGFAAAAKALGWTPTSIAYAGDPASVATAFQQAISDKPDAIEVDAESPGTIATSLKAAAAAHIPVFEEATEATPTGIAGGGLTGVEFGPKYTQAEADSGADWILKNAGGSVDVAIVTLPSLAVITQQVDDFVATLSKYCPTCKTKVINQQFTDIGRNTPSAVVSALQSDPSLKYVYFPYGDVSTGVPAALKAANISATIVDGAADAAQYADVKSGAAASIEVSSALVQGWVQIDAVARYFDTNKPVDDDITPMKIWDKTNASSATLPVSPPDYMAQFEKIWHVSS